MTAASVKKWTALNCFQKLLGNWDNDAPYQFPVATPILATIVDFVNPHVKIRSLFV